MTRLIVQHAFGFGTPAMEPQVADHVDWAIELRLNQAIARADIDLGTMYANTIQDLLVDSGWDKEPLPVPPLPGDTRHKKDLRCDISMTLESGEKVIGEIEFRDKDALAGDFAKMTAAFDLSTADVGILILLSPELSNLMKAAGGMADDHAHVDDVASEYRLPANFPVIQGSRRGGHVAVFQLEVAGSGVRYPSHMHKGVLGWIDGELK